MSGKTEMDWNMNEQMNKQISKQAVQPLSYMPKLSNFSKNCGWELIASDSPTVVSGC